MPNHWGLIFVDLANREMYFDDGLMPGVPTVALVSVKQLLELLLEMFPCHSTLPTSFWQSCLGFQRFGVPSQLPLSHKMVGVGSCGVIMAVRHIFNGPCPLTPSSGNAVKWICTGTFDAKDS